MTVIGVLTSADTAAMWADGETFCRGGRPAGTDEVKLWVNDAGFGACATGKVGLVRELGESMKIVATFERLRGSVPNWLRAAHRAKFPDDRGSLVVIAGWDHGLARCIAYVLAAPQFEPYLVTRHLSPAVDLPGVINAAPSQIPTIAQRQLARLRRKHPSAMGGHLLTASLGRGFARLWELPTYASELEGAEFTSPSITEGRGGLHLPSVAGGDVIPNNRFTGDG